MHLRLGDLSFLSDTPEYPPIEISEATLGSSDRCFTNYLKTQFYLSDLIPIWVILNPCVLVCCVIYMLSTKPL